MPRYKYIAKSTPNKIIQAEIVAESLQEAINKITKLGYFPISVDSGGLPLEKKNILGFRKISNKDVLLFTRQLASLTESGINILNSLNIIQEQTGNKFLKAVIGGIIARIKDGKPFSQSLAQHPEIFPSLYTSMIHSGEVGGTLEEAVKRLADFLEKEEEFKNSLQAALTYPAFVFLVGILTIAVLLGFVIPRLVTMFQDMGQALPLPTRILIDSSNLLRSYWWLILLLLGISILLLRRGRQNQKFKVFWDTLKLKLAVFGEIVLKTEISRLTRSLSLLLSSGTTIIYSLEISSSLLGNEALKIELRKVKEQLNAGLSLSGSLKGSRLFPAFVINIISVGEETGTLEKSFLRIADDYEREVDRYLKTLTRLLEPIIILVMGLIVGFIVLSMLLPIFQINLIAR